VQPGHAPREYAGPEHDVVGQKLRAALEQVLEALLAVLGVESVVLVDRNPRKLEPLPADLLVALRLLGLDLRELLARRLPFLTDSSPVLGHHLLPSGCCPNRSWQHAT
jgi:hypothetical protein